MRCLLRPLSRRCLPHSSPWRKARLTGLPTCLLSHTYSRVMTVSQTSGSSRDFGTLYCRSATLVGVMVGM